MDGFIINLDENSIHSIIRSKLWLSVIYLHIICAKLWIIDADTTTGLEKLKFSMLESVEKY